jgi:hypothetical protein
MRDTVAGRMRRTAATLDHDHPEMVGGDHLRDAATVLQHGSTEGAKRHLDAAMELLTPRNLVRHGIRDDEGHATAKHHMHEINRHRLLVQDVEDLHTRNEQITEALRATSETIAQTGPAQLHPSPSASTAPAVPKPAVPPPAAVPSPGGRPPPPRPKQLSNAIELRNVANELRDPFGKWSVGGAAGFPLRKRDARGGQAMLQAMQFQPSLHEKPASFFGTQGSVFGRHLSPAEAIGAAAALAPKPMKPGQLHPGQQAEFDSLSKSQKVIYHKLIARGRAHSGAFVIARKFQPGMLQSAVLARRGPAIELAFWQHELRAPSGKWMRAGSSAAGHLDGQLAHGVTARGQRVRGYYNHTTGTITPRHSGRVPVRFVQPATSRAPHVHSGLADVPWPHPRKVGHLAALRALRHPFTRLGTASLSNSIELGEAWLHELRGPGGEWMSPDAAGFPHQQSHPDLSKITQGLVEVGPSTLHLHGDPVVARASTGERVTGMYDAHHQMVYTPHGPVPVTHVKGRAPGGRLIEKSASGEGRAARAGLSLMSPGRGQSSAQAFIAAMNASAMMPAGSLSNVATRTTDLSARTAMLERTPAPRGRPGGPGLYHVKGLGHTAYEQQIVKALIEKRGMPPGKAYAIARAAIRKWSRGGGHVHPEVRAAAGRAEAGEIARQARAHAHTADAWDVADTLIELATVVDLFNPYHAPPGSPAGGTFTTAQGAGAKQQKQQAARKDRRGDRAQRQQLTRKIAGIRSQIAALQAQLPKTTRGAHKATATKKAAKPVSAKAAAAAAARKAKAGATPRKKTVAKLSPATIHAKIAALRATLRADIAQLRSIH